MGIDPVTIGAIVAAASATAGGVAAVQQYSQQKDARQSASDAAKEQARQLRSAAAQERNDRIKRLQIAQGRTLALTAASGGVAGTGELLLGQLVRDAQADLATSSANSANRLAANSAQRDANLASIGRTNLGLSAASTALGAGQTYLGTYQAATQINSALSTPPPPPQGMAASLGLRSGDITR